MAEITSEGKLDGDHCNCSVLMSELFKWLISWALSDMQLYDVIYKLIIDYICSGTNKGFFFGGGGLKMKVWLFI